MRRSVGLALCAGLLSSCGYTLKGAASRLVQEEGISKIFVRPVTTLPQVVKPGVEILIYNELMRMVASSRQVKLVSSEQEADAILQAKVQAVDQTPSAFLQASTLQPVGVVPSGVLLATEYTATLSCAFQLNRKDLRPGKKPLVWSQGLSRSKPFAASNQLDVLGTTSALINDSEFDRAIAEMARRMVNDVHESMVTAF